MSLVERLLGLLLVPCPACGGTGKRQRQVRGMQRVSACVPCKGRGWRLGRGRR